FFSVGASGFLVNYVVTMLLTSGLSELWYLHANIFGILASISTNFILNKIWTFEDRDFSRKKILSQYGKFGLFSSLGALIQLGMVFWLVDSYDIAYPLALISAITAAAFSNFVLNKKLTFKEKLWN
ncbi:MAG: GtrA family protein, partial [Nitrosopumilus sp.]|nr:GtrA family protein [Nitrosopumilus sp.]